MLLDDSCPGEDEEFEALLDELGLRQALATKQDDSLETLKTMWRGLKLDANPETMVSFEDMLTRLTVGVNEKSAENEQLEHRIRTDKRVEDERIKQIYQEMEDQLNMDRLAIRRCVV